VKEVLEVGRVKHWTPEELDYLESCWGAISIKGIAKHLGRTENAVKIKAQRIGLGDPMEHYDGLTVNKLAEVLNVSYSNIKYWIARNDFPARTKVFASKKKVLVITWQDFWKWAEENKQVIDFSRVEVGYLGPEPKWVAEKRKADQIRNVKIKRTPWTIDDDATLKHMLNAFEYSYTDIAKRLRRTEGAVKRRIRDLGLKQRPVRRDNHIKYTDEEVQQLVMLYDKGYDLDTIAERLNKSALGVRGKLERMGYRFNNGVPYLEKEIG
jgi:transposase